MVKWKEIGNEDETINVVKIKLQIPDAFILVPLFWRAKMLSTALAKKKEDLCRYYTQYGPITNVGIFPGLGVLYFYPDFQG